MLAYRMVFLDMQAYACIMLTAVVDASICRLKKSGGGGTFNGMDGWQASVEARLGELKTEIRGLRDEARTDFRVLFGAIIAVALGLAGLMAKGFHWF